MIQYKKQFDRLLWVKIEPTEGEKALLERGKRYIQKLSQIPGIEMISIVNSVSMYATHENSDIDLFIITKPEMIWFVRFFTILILWIQGVWRHGDDIAGNFCLSFFITNEAIDLSKIAIENDIYLYYWIYYMKPIVNKNKTYERFLATNSWVDVNEEQRGKNKIYVISDCLKAMNSAEFGGKNCFSQIESNIEITKWGHPNGIFNATESQRSSFSPPNTFDTFGSKSIDKGDWKNIIYRKINNIIRHFLLPRTQKTYQQIWKPEWVIISDQMLKFHDSDRRKIIRDTIMEKYFDK